MSGIPADSAGRETLAAEYVLGTLDRRTAQAVAAALPRDVGLRGLVAGWERRLMPLAALVPEVAAPAGSWAALEAALARTPRRVLDRPLEEDGWQAVSPGVARKTLWNDDTYLLRVAPDAVVPPHRHARVEHCVVIRGRMVVDGRSMGPGDYQGVQAGVGHHAIHAPEGLLLLIREGD